MDSGRDVELAAAFGYAAVARAYQYRPPYPDEVFDVLTGLISGRPRTVLDLGAGEGALARPLARRVDRVDAVDISAAMVEAGRTRPGGRALFRQQAEHYVEQFHSTASLAREWVPPAEAAAFDREVQAVIAAFAADGVLDTPITARVSWGRILTGPDSREQTEED